MVKFAYSRMLLLKDISTLQEHRTTATTITHVNTERIDRWHLCESRPYPRGLPVAARLLVCALSLVRQLFSPDSLYSNTL